MTEELKAPEGQERDEIPDVQRVGGRVEAAIQRRGARGQALGQRGEIGAVGVEAAPVEFVEERHCVVRQ